MRTPFFSFFPNPHGGIFTKTSGRGRVKVELRYAYRCREGKLDLK